MPDITGKKDNSSKRGVPEQQAQQRREDAEARTAEYQALTPEEKLARLEQRPGDSRRERARIAAQSGRKK